MKFMTQTLLSLAGADLSPAPLSTAAVILVDCQQEYVDGALPLYRIADALAGVSELLARARRAGAPVIHIAHKGRPGGLFDRTEGGKGDFAPEAAPASGESIVEKALPNAFAGTDLQEILQSTGRRELIVAGFMTHMCISSTVRAAMDLGYRSTVVAAACTTRDLPKPGGGIIAAQTLHDACLAALGDRFAIIAGNVADIAD
jgi:nicotinamidase-related amidase